MTIWAMFGIANQMLAVIALAIVSAYLANIGKARYLWVTVIPLCFVATTTSTAAAQMLAGDWTGIATQIAKPAGTRDAVLIGKALMRGGSTLAMLVCGGIVVLAAAWRIWTATNGLTESRGGFEPVMEPVIVK
jgi:carbon starvation protein